MECDPLVGVGKVSQICESTCDKLYDACKDEFFQARAVPGDALEPCADESLVCSPLQTFFSSGYELCSAYGLSVGQEMCYDGRVNGELTGEPEKKLETNKAMPFNKAQLKRLLWEIANNLSDKEKVAAFGVLAITTAVLVKFSVALFSSSEPSSGRQLGYE